MEENFSQAFYTQYILSLYCILYISYVLLHSNEHLNYCFRFLSFLRCYCLSYDRCSLYYKFFVVRYIFLSLQFNMKIHGHTQYTRFCFYRFDCMSVHSIHLVSLRLVFFPYFLFLYLRIVSFSLFIKRLSQRNKKREIFSFFDLVLNTMVLSSAWSIVKICIRKMIFFQKATKKTRQNVKIEGW